MNKWGAIEKRPGKGEQRRSDTNASSCDILYFFPCRLQQLKSTVSAFRLCFFSCNYYGDVNCKYLQFVWFLRPAFVFMFSDSFFVSFHLRIFCCLSPLPYGCVMRALCELMLPNCTHNWIIIEFDNNKKMNTSERTRIEIDVVHVFVYFLRNN